MSKDRISVEWVTHNWHCPKCGTHCCSEDDNVTEDMDMYEVDCQSGNCNHKYKVFI